MGCRVKPGNDTMPSGHRFCLQVRYPGISPPQEIAEQGGIFGAHGLSHRGPLGQRLAPACQFRLAGENSEIADLIENVEITKHRTEYRVHERKTFTIEPWRSDHACLQPRKTQLQLSGLGPKWLLVQRAVKTRDSVEDLRAEFDPGTMLGTPQRICRMQRLRFGLF